MYICVCVFILYLFTEKNQKTKQLLIKVVTYAFYSLNYIYMQLIDCSTRNMYNVRYKRHTTYFLHSTQSITYADGYK